MGSVLANAAHIHTHPTMLLKALCFAGLLALTDEVIAKKGSKRGFRRFYLTREEWQKQAAGGKRAVYCRGKAGGWCRNLAPENAVCERRHAGTYPASAKDDEKLIKMGVKPMCGTNRYFSCGWKGEFEEKSCDDELMRYFKEGTKFPELLSPWQLSQARKAKWWGSCRTNSEAPLWTPGWDGVHQLRYDDAACEWNKEKLPEPEPEQADPTLDKDDDYFYDLYMAFDNGDDTNSV